MQGSHPCWWATFKAQSCSWDSSSPFLLCLSRITLLHCLLLVRTDAVPVISHKSHLALPASALKELCVIPAQIAGDSSGLPPCRVQKCLTQHVWRRKVQAVLGPQDKAHPSSSCPSCFPVRWPEVLGSAHSVHKHRKWCQIGLYRITSSALCSVYFKQTWEGVWAGSLFVLEGIDAGFRVLIHPSSIWR